MNTDQNPPQADAATRPRDLLSRLYREIGISAVAAALEATARTTQRPSQKQRKEIPAILRNDEAA
jgi:hypothetical protein